MVPGEYALHPGRNRDGARLAAAGGYLQSWALQREGRGGAKVNATYTIFVPVNNEEHDIFPSDFRTQCRSWGYSTRQM